VEGKYGHLLVEDMGDVCTVVINRPGDRNSMNSEMMRELIDLIVKMERADKRALIFTGAGETYFIGGADGIEMMQCDADGARRFSQRIQDLFNRMEASPLILVAAINGLCFGGGFEFAMACDVRIASTDSRIGLPEVKVGLIPGGGGTQRLPRLVGEGKAMEMILSGNLYKGSDALQMGLAHRVVKTQDLLKEAHEFLKPILLRPQYALSLAKHAIYASRGQSLESGLEVEKEQFGLCFEQNFFPDLMRRQIKEGLLQTTAEISQLTGGNKR